MSTPCIGGSYIARMNAAIIWSEESRVAATERGEEIGDEARAELIERYRLKKVAPPSQPMLDTVANKAIENDERWGVLVSQEQWACRLAAMYSSAELVVSTREQTQILDAIFIQNKQLIELNTQLVDEQRTTNDLLRRLVRALAPAQPTTAPYPQRTGD